MESVEAELDNLLAEFENSANALNTKSPRAAPGGSKPPPPTTSAPTALSNKPSNTKPDSSNLDAGIEELLNELQDTSLRTPKNVNSLQAGSTPARPQQPNPNFKSNQNNNALNRLQNYPNIIPQNSNNNNQSLPQQNRPQTNLPNHPQNSQTLPHQKQPQNAQTLQPQNVQNLQPQNIQPQKIQPQNVQTFQPQNVQTFQPQNLQPQNIQPQKIQPQNVQNLQPQNIQPQKIQPQNVQTFQPQNVQTFQPQNVQNLQPQNVQNQPQRVQNLQPQNLQPQNIQNQPQRVQNLQPQNQKINVQTLQPQRVQNSQNQNNKTLPAQTIHHGLDNPHLDFAAFADQFAAENNLNDELAILGMNDLADSSEQKMEMMGFVRLPNTNISWDEDGNTASDFKVSGSTNTQVNEVHDIVIKPFCDDQPCPIICPTKYLSVDLIHSSGLVLPPWIRDNEDNTYSLGFCCPEEGTINMKIYLIGQLLFNLNIFVSPGGDEKQWIARCPPPQLNKTWNILIMRVDGQIPEGRHPFEVQSQGPLQDLVIKPVHGGYQITCTPVSVGAVKVDISLFGNMIQGSPVRATITDPKIAAPLPARPQMNNSPSQVINLQPMNRLLQSQPQQAQAQPSYGGLQPQNIKTSQASRPNPAVPTSSNNPTRATPQKSVNTVTADDALASLLDELDNY